MQLRVREGSPGVRYHHSMVGRSCGKGSLWAWSEKEELRTVEVMKMMNWCGCLQVRVDGDAGAWETTTQLSARVRGASDSDVGRLRASHPQGLLLVHRRLWRRHGDLGSGKHWAGFPSLDVWRPGQSHWWTGMKAALQLTCVMVCLHAAPRIVLCVIVT